MHRVELKDETQSFFGDVGNVFLMHRVELKGLPCSSKYLGLLTVPNAPCGVESEESFHASSETTRFLMHRVELKARRTSSPSTNTFTGFLMHRVELKEKSSRASIKVPTCS